MAADPNIFFQGQSPVRSATDYANDYATADAKRNANALQALSLQQQTSQVGQQVAASNALARIAQGWNSDTSVDQRIADLRNSGLAPLMTQADTLQTAADNRTKVNADAAKATADAAKTTQGIGEANYTQAMQKVLAFQSPADAIASLNNAVASGKIDMQHAVMMQRSIPQNDPAAFDAWKRNWAIGIADPAKMAELLAPHITTVNTGGQQVTQAVNPVTLQPTTVSTMANTVSPDTQAREAGENARSAAQRQVQLQIAGMGPNGQISPALEAEAQMIAAGKAAPPSGMAATRPAAAALMARVSQINPDYDATTYGAKVAAAKGFTSGQQGNALRSISTANEHLAQLDALGDALNNGNYPLINQIGNSYGIQTGQAPAQVFNAVKNVVAQEVVKAIVAGGGSAGERDEAAHAFSVASSPQQLKQTITALRNVMSAQQTNLMEQRRAAGLPDATLPQYGGHGGAGGAGGGGVQLPTADAIAAEIARRGGK